MESSSAQEKRQPAPAHALALAPSTLFLAAVVIGATSPTPLGLLGAALVAAVGMACAVFLLSPPRRRAGHRRRKPRLKPKTALGAGDYVALAGNLYRVEHVLGDRVLIEDCRSGELFDSAAADVEKARKVRCSKRPVNAAGGG